MADFKNIHINPLHCGLMKPINSQIGLYLLDLLSVVQFTEMFLNLNAF